MLLTRVLTAGWNNDENFIRYSRPFGFISRLMRELYVQLMEYLLLLIGEKCWDW